jgi:hypothetical protein
MQRVYTLGSPTSNRDSRQASGVAQTCRQTATSLPCTLTCSAGRTIGS